MQMLALRPAWDEFERVWVTLPGVDVEYLLAAEREVIFAYGPAVGNRGLLPFFRNILLALRVFRTHQPRALISTGAGVAVPFLVLGRVLGCTVVYVESLSRVRGLSLTGRVAAWVAHSTFVQWPEAASKRTRYAGSIL